MPKVISRLLTCLLLCCWLVAAPAPAAAAEGRVLVLNYHHLDARPRTSSTISPALFAEHMKYLKEQGYQVISLQQLKDYLLKEPARGHTDNKPLPRRAVLITFDDGYASFYEHAFPVLKQYNFPAAMFTIAGKVSNSPNEIPKLTWAQVKEMAAGGLVDFQSHTYNMHYLVGKKSALLAEAARQVREDLQLSRDVLAFHTGRPVNAIAYPYGHWDRPLLQLARQEGFVLGFTLYPGAVQKGMNPLHLPRVAVGDEKINVQEFARLLQKYLPE
ncbi:hypothetical protein JCM39194_22020 [Desulfotomaculum varum]